MKKTMKVKGIALASILFAVSATFLINFNLKQEYKPGDYVKEEDAYFVGKIEDEAGHIKAHKLVTPTDNKYSSQKTRSLGREFIGDIESVWNSYTGKGTTVAVIDDGFDYNHPEYRRADGTSAILNTSRYYYEKNGTAYYKSFSSDPSCIEEDWEDTKWATHGTNTSSTAAAPMNNNGGVGIAPEADILALKVDLEFASIDAAIRYAVAQKVDVINISLGAYAETFTDGWGETQSGSSSVATILNSACQLAYESGVIVVAAAGNESTWHKSYPACNYKVVGVGALGDWDNKGNADELAEFTNYVKSSQKGEINVDILAPGYVYTAHQLGTKNSIQHGYGDTQGTSFSSPIVAGAACLWKQKNPNGTPDQFLSELQETAADIGSYKNKMIKVSGWDSSLSDVGPSNITCGRLDVANLLQINEPYISIKQGSVNIAVGENKQIDLDTYNGDVSYSIADTDIATVSNSGVVTGVAEGNTTLTVTAMIDSKSDSVSIPVTVNPVIATTSISINPTSITLEAGHKYNIEPTITTVPANATRVFAFASNDESIATVDYESGLLTAKKQGSTTIDIISGFGDGDATLTVNVTKPTTPTAWTKITSDAELTDGDYLIVYEDGNKAFNGGLNTLDGTNNNIAVTINGNSIAYDDATNAAKFTINSFEDGYTIRSASGYYIGRTNSSNGLDSSPSTQYKNYISISSGDATIASTGGKVLCFNTANDQQRFRYITSGGDIQLYKCTGGSASSIAVTGVGINPTNLTLERGDTSSLTATVYPINATNQDVTWSSSNTSVATVTSSGVVTAVSNGSAVITVKTDDGNFTATCAITVKNPKVLSSISVYGQKTTFTLNESFTFGGVVSATFDDASIVDVTEGATFSGYDLSVEGEQTVTVSFTYHEVTKTTTYAIDVVNSSTYENTFSYTDVGDTWSLNNYSDANNYLLCPSDGNVSVAIFPDVFRNKIIASNVVITLNVATYGSGTNPDSSAFKIYSDSECEHLVSSSQSGTLPNDSSYKNTVYTVEQEEASNKFEDDLVVKITKPGKQIRFKSATIQFDYVTLADKIVDSLSATYTGPSIYTGCELDESNISVTAHYTKSEKYADELLSNKDYSVSTLDSSTAGNKSVTITYTGSLNVSTDPMTTTVNIQVVADEVTAVAVSCSKAFHPGEKIYKSDITVTLSWKSGKANTTTTDFTFADNEYMFTYEDAPSGGSAGSKQFSINYAGNNYNFNVSVSRSSYVAPSTQNLTLTGTQGKNAGITGTGASQADNYNNLSINGVTCAVTNIYVYTKSGTNYFSFGKASGEIHNTQALSSPIKSFDISVQAGARSDQKLYVSTNGNSWVLLANANLNTTNYYFFKAAYEGESSLYSNFNNINLVLRGNDTLNGLVNYLMFEDTNNQCTTKLDIALLKLNTLSSADKTSFWESNDYCVAKARERILAWAAHEGKTINEIDGNYVAESSSRGFIKNEKINNGVLIITIISTAFALVSLGGYYLIKKNKH